MEYLSDGIYDMCGYPASDFIDNNVRSYASIIHPDDIQLVNDAVQDGVRKKQPYVIEYRVIDVDGNERWCYEKGRGVFDDDGELRWLDGAIFDTTERKQAEEDLRLFRTLVDHSDDAVFMIEMETGRFIDVNKRACVNLGYAQDELLAMHVEEIEATIPGQCSWQERTRQVRRQGMLTIEGRHVRRDGTLFPVEVNIRYVRDKNKDYLVAVARDITERERAEAERHHLETRIREAERMESLGVMAGGIAHDFNNLLTGVLGNVELVLADVPEGSSKRESLEDIQKCATRAAELTYQMLAYSGKDLFVAETVNVNSLIRRMMPVARAAVPDGIDLTIDLAGNVAAINAGPAQIRQVVTVLLTNAAEAIGDEEGAISITTAAVHIGPAAAAGGRSESAPDGDYVVIKVADTGAGMDEDTLARAFDPFFTTKFTGRGLGLSAAQGIVHGHNGAISIESEPGKGTTVRVLLPLLTEPATAEPVSIG
jgi:PAS domain S-box-containing protein